MTTGLKRKIVGERKKLTLMELVKLMSDNDNIIFNMSIVASNSGSSPLMEGINHEDKS